MAPIFEVLGNRVSIKGNLEVAYEEGEVLLFPESPKAAQDLKNLVARYPSAEVKLIGDDDGELTVEGAPIDERTINTKYTRVIEPENLQPAPAA